MELQMENNIEQVQGNLNNNIENLIGENVTEESQNNFLQSTLGKVINTGLDLGLRAVLPSMVEDQVIDIKNTLFNQGLKEGISSAINSAIDLGKSALGIVTGKFENLSQVQTAIKKGGIIDTLSDSINNVLNASTKNGLIGKSTARLIKNGKKAILDTISSNIEEKFTSQLKAIEKISKYSSNWNEYYNNKDLSGMEKEYKKMKTQLAEIIPLEETLKQARKIENIHNLLKNKGVNYELSQEEKELVDKLA